ncbi:bifunctional 5,10-methylenetetrahydrofolate dehydrogenase/5,10-methenyltetrahydrofolate cyclohydrolase [Candidatus Saccharibacteria bacterium]|nr:bifunctional 5,10-methylenetetrahydrofolate dehydrogenase/5,10-methenyltetrahydrofolate cyclohydrolase [Candidatus Saccharibacteria bacterium]
MSGSDGRDSSRRVKILDGRELAGFVKERQAAEVRSIMGRGGVDNLGRPPKLLIIRDSDNLVITKYVGLKARYGEDIGVLVEDFCAKSIEEVRARILEANEDPAISGMIVQLPLKDPTKTDEVVSLIAPEKDVDGLSGASSKFDSATATAINWLLTGYDISLAPPAKIALVGRGRLVGGPLIRMFEVSGYDFDVFGHDSDLTKLNQYDIIITATGKPRLISDSMIKPGAVVVDAGTASEDGVLVGDIDDKIRERDDLRAITPKVGGVGPLTVSVLFDNVIRAAGK